MERKELERFLEDNPDLERLEAIVSDSNPFVAMGWTRQEVRHSAYLCWILDPAESHGLGSYPLRIFLKFIVGRGVAGPEVPTLFDVDGWDLTSTSATTEWEQTDLFLQNDSERFVVVVENKIDSKEHGDQLARARRGGGPARRGGSGIVSADLCESSAGIGSDFRIPARSAAAA